MTARKSVALIAFAVAFILIVGVSAFAPASAFAQSNKPNIEDSNYR